LILLGIGQFRHRAAAGLLDAGDLEVGPAGVREPELARIAHTEADFAEVVGGGLKGDGWGCRVRYGLCLLRALRNDGLRGGYDSGLGLFGRCLR